MYARQLALAALAFAVLASAVAADPGDTIRLSLPGGPQADTLTLKATNADLAAPLEDVYYRGGFRGGFYGGGYRGGYYGGGYRGYYGGGGYYGGYRGYYGGGGYYGGYRGYYGGGGYYGGYYPRYYSNYYYSPIYYSYPVYTYYPISLGPVQQPTTTLRVVPNPTVSPNGPGYMPPADTRVLPPPTLDKGKDGSFQYDGGPKDMIPLPKDSSPMGTQSRPRVVEDLAVSISQASLQGSGKWQYPAYGEAPRRRNNGTSNNAKFELVVLGQPSR